MTVLGLILVLFVRGYNLISNVSYFAHDMEFGSVTVFE